MVTPVTTSTHPGRPVEPRTTLASSLPGGVPAVELWLSNNGKPQLSKNYKLTPSLAAEYRLWHKQQPATSAPATRRRRGQAATGADLVTAADAPTTKVRTARPAQAAAVAAAKTAAPAPVAPTSAAALDRAVEATARPLPAAGTSAARRLPLHALANVLKHPIVGSGLLGVAAAGATIATATVGLGSLMPTSSETTRAETSAGFGAAAAVVGVAMLQHRGLGALSGRARIPYAGAAVGGLAVALMKMTALTSEPNTPSHVSVHNKGQV